MVLPSPCNNKVEGELIGSKLIGSMCNYIYIYIYFLFNWKFESNKSFLLLINTFSPCPKQEIVVKVIICLIFVEAWGGCEANGETADCIEIHLDGEEHWHWARPDDTWTWHHPTESLLLLAKERCLGGAQGFTWKQALDISKADHYSSQSGYWYHQFVAAEWWKSGVSFNVNIFESSAYYVISRSLMNVRLLLL